MNLNEIGIITSNNFEDQVVENNILGATFVNCVFREIKFDTIKIKNCIFQDCIFRDCNFADVEFENSSIEDSKIIKSSFTDCRFQYGLSRDCFGDLQTNFRLVELTEIKLKNIFIQGADLNLKIENLKIKTLNYGAEL